MNAATAFYSTFNSITQANKYLFSFGYSRRSGLNSGLKLPIDYFSTLATYVIGYPIAFLIAGIVFGIVSIVDLFKSPAAPLNNSSIKPLESVVLEDRPTENDSLVDKSELLNQKALTEKKEDFQNKIKTFDALINSKITALDPVFKAHEDQLACCSQLKDTINTNELTARYAEKISHYKTHKDSKISCACGKMRCSYGICLYCKKEITRIEKFKSIPVKVPDLEQRQLACKKRPVLAQKLELETNKLSTTRAPYEKSIRHKASLNDVKNRLSDLHYLIETANHADDWGALASTYQELVKEVEVYVSSEDDYLKRDLIGKTSQQMNDSSFFQPYSADKQEENTWLNYLDFGSG